MRKGDASQKRERETGSIAQPAKQARAPRARKERTRDLALAHAIELIGSDARTAELLGITKQAVWFWTRCPDNHVLALERLSGVSRFDLRPDRYPRELGSKRPKPTPLVPQEAQHQKPQPADIKPYETQESSPEKNSQGDGVNPHNHSAKSKNTRLASVS
jgi:DNA-binding transcriptional regulator YdaS (Cro superfamily)